MLVVLMHGCLGPFVLVLVLSVLQWSRDLLGRSYRKWPTIRRAGRYTLFNLVL